MPTTVALIAHDGKKDEMVQFAKANLDLLRTFDLVATGSTGRLVAEATGLSVRTVLHGPNGGDVQIAFEVLEDRVAAVFFFVEPMDVHAHDPDIRTLMRICNLKDVPLAINPATGRLVARGLAGGLSR